MVHFNVLPQKKGEKMICNRAFLYKNGNSLR